MWIAWWLGCAERVVLDFEGTCAGVWPADTCAGGDCADTDLEARWVATFPAAFGAGADHARVRAIAGGEGTFRSISHAAVEVDIDWVRVVQEVELWTDDADPTDEALVAAWRDWLRVPALDLDAELMPFEEVQAFVDDCAAQFGVTFDAADWCDPWYPTDPDDDGRGPRFDFEAPLEGTTYVEASIDVTGSEAPSCETNETIVD